MRHDDPQDYLDRHEARAVAELTEFVAIPSIAAQPDRAADVRRAAEWVAARMASARIEHVALMPSALHPAVYGDWLHAPSKPTVLIYGHFDVMPPGPPHLWASPPFAPEIRDGRLYGRGASDDKGSMLAPILAAEALLRTVGALPINVKFLFEGQEELGSPHMGAFVAEHRDLLAADLVLNADSGQRSEGQPSQVLGMRGLCLLDFALIGPAADLHSGQWGGAIQNPLHAIAELVASFHDRDGRVAVAGFYDDVREPTAEERADARAEPWDEAAEREQVGIPAFFGEPGYTPRERATLRPTLEINGVWGGYTGEGPMTVIPREARAKISCRLVADQDPRRVLDCITAHIAAHTPTGVTVEISPYPDRARAYRLPPGHDASAIVGDLLAEIYGRAPIPVRSGSSVPLALAALHEHLGAPLIGFAFALPDDGIHGPDESFRLASFARAQRAYALLLERLAAWRPGQDEVS